MITELGTVLESLPVAVVVFNEEKQIEFLNHASENLFGATREQLVGNVIHCEGFPFQEERERLAAALNGFLNDPDPGPGPPVTLASSLLDPAHPDPLTPKPTRLYRDPPNTLTLKNCSLLFKFFSIPGLPDGKKWVGLFLQDLTEERIFYNEMMLEEKVSGFKVLSAGIAHEINNPLQAILSFAEGILFQESLEKAKEFAITILERTRHVASVVSDFTTALQVYPKYATQVDVVEQVEKALHIAFLSCYADYVRVEKVFEGRPRIKAQPEDIKQVLFSILCNAIEAMEGKGCLLVQVKEDAERVCLRVEDDGPGIPPEFMNRIFDPFFSTKGQGRGTGLGLHVARALAEKNNGEIKVYSDEGKGCVFEVLFPV